MWSSLSTTNPMGWWSETSFSFANPNVMQFLAKKNLFGTWPPPQPRTLYKTPNQKRTTWRQDMQKTLWNFYTQGHYKSPIYSIFMLQSVFHDNARGVYMLSLLLVRNVFLSIILFSLYMWMNTDSPCNDIFCICCLMDIWLSSYVKGALQSPYTAQATWSPYTEVALLRGFAKILHCGCFLRSLYSGFFAKPLNRG